MEREELISELKTRVGETILSERSLTEYANNILPMIPEGEIPETFWSAHLGVLKTMEGQLRHEKAEFAKTFKEEWEKKHQTPPAPPATPPAPAPGSGNEGEKGNEGMEALVKQFIESQKVKDENLLKQLETYSKTIKDMQERLDAKDRQVREADTRNAISKALRALGEVNEGVLKYAISEVDLSSDKTVEAMIEEAKASYGRIYKEMFGESGVPFHGNKGEDPDNSTVNSFIQAIQESAKAQTEKMEAQKKQLI